MAADSTFGRLRRELAALRPPSDPATPALWTPPAADGPPLPAGILDTAPPGMVLVRLRRESAHVTRYEVYAPAADGPRLLEGGRSRSPDPWPDTLAEYEHLLFGPGVDLPADPPPWPFFTLLPPGWGDAPPGHPVLRILVQQVRPPGSPVWLEWYWRPDGPAAAFIRPLEVAHTEAQARAADRGRLLLIPAAPGRRGGSGWTVGNRAEFRQRYDPIVTRLLARGSKPSLVNVAHERRGSGGHLDAWKKAIQRDRAAAGYADWGAYLAEFVGRG